MENAIGFYCVYKLFIIIFKDAMIDFDNIVLNEIRKLAINPDYISTIVPPVSEDKSKILRMVYEFI